MKDREGALVAEYACFGEKNQAAVLERLHDAAAYPHPVRSIRHFETHISHVFLTGKFAYKIKKPVNFGFLDFSTLELRHFFCNEELRLNRRLAPDLYREVVALGEGGVDLCAESGSKPLEYAVKMREFPQAARFAQLLADGNLGDWQIDALAARVASFHLYLEPARVSDDYGSSATVWASFSQVLGQLRFSLSQTGTHRQELDSLNAIETWLGQEYARLRNVIDGRKQAGFIRECHGDLHLENIAWWHDAPQVFDGIEFNPRLRWVDVMSDIAFTTMDLTVRGHPDYACRFLNRYLETTGDYLGIQVLQIYEVYRALVRAMVDCLVVQTCGKTLPNGRRPQYRDYLAFAERALTPRKLALILMHGYSGSGKSTVAQRVLETTGAIRIRSDVERKRLHGMAATDHRNQGGDCRGIYDAQSTDITYLKIAWLARHVLDAGLTVVVDAASLKAWQRELFRSLAQRQGIPFWLLSCRADQSTLRERLDIRARAGTDVSDADRGVLRWQEESGDPLSPEELAHCLIISQGQEDLSQIIQRILNHAARPTGMEAMTPC